VGPRAILDMMVKKKIPSTRRELKPRTPIVLPVSQHYTDCTALNNKDIHFCQLLFMGVELFCLLF
jgi:hypothetical protein